MLQRKKRVWEHGAFYANEIRTAWIGYIQTHIVVKLNGQQIASFDVTEWEKMPKKLFERGSSRPVSQKALWNAFRAQLEQIPVENLPE